MSILDEHQTSKVTHTEQSPILVPTWPPTIIVVHAKERRRKCTVQPLRGQPGFVFWRHPRRGTESLNGYVRLGLGGPPLSRQDAESGLLILDGTWRWASGMEAEFQALPVRGLAPWVSAYPRTSKVFDDPTGGLATIEALFAAYAQLGRSTEGLLDSYHWKNRYLELNEARLLEHSGRFREN